jgi:hypothetical protein
VAPNKYMLGAAALAATPSPDRQAVGWQDMDYKQILYDPAGGLYRYFNQPADRYYDYSAGPNSYWKQQRQQQRVSPGATLTSQRQLQARQLRDTLLQQQAANTASLRSQLSQMFPGTGAPAQTGASPAPPAPGGYTQPYAPQESAPQSQSDDAYQSEDVVGAQNKNAASSSSKFPPGSYVVVRVKNMPDVIRSQSALGKLGLMGAPRAIEQIAYGKMAEKMQAGMADEGVDAEVTVTEQPPTRTSGSDIVTGAIAGASGVGLIWLLVKLVGRKRR